MNDLQLEDRLMRMEQMLAANKEVLTFDEACLYSGISRSYMYKLTAKNLIPYSKPRGKLIYFEKNKLNAWLLGNQKS
tara:strand:- start:1192 stop:1422 length:231 start_codon:yes stop_codon:yes gene_type:complete